MLISKVFLMPNRTALTFKNGAARKPGYFRYPHLKVTKVTKRLKGNRK
jgi:hypothetical protein